MDQIYTCLLPAHTYDMNKRLSFSGISLVEQSCEYELDIVFYIVPVATIYRTNIDLDYHIHMPNQYEDDVLL